MFDGLFKPKFYTKCKTLVKITKTRVDTVKRKKSSVCKYLKNDIVDLLKNNLDYNAYGRAEGLIEEKRRLACYDSLEQFCICVASNVSLLQKSSRCPDECCEAISSLVYAAARVSEVPELRDLRSLFADRYGNSLDQFVNPEFVERFKAEPPSKEMKIQLLQEVAKEQSIKWDAKALEQRLYTPPPPPPAAAQEEPLHHETKTKTEANTTPEKSIESKRRLSFHSRKSSVDESSSSIMSATSEDDDSMSTSESCATIPEEDPPFYYRFMPAPYTNTPKIEKHESLPEKITISHLKAEDTDTESPSEGKPKPRSVRRRFPNQPPSPKVETTTTPVEESSLKQTSMNMRSEAGGGEGMRRMSRRTSSWQPRPSPVPDFDEVAARVDALSRD